MEDNEIKKLLLQLKIAYKKLRGVKLSFDNGQRVKRLYKDIVEARRELNKARPEVWKITSIIREINDYTNADASSTESS